MPVLTQRRRQFRTAAIVLAAIATIAGLYLLFPFGSDRSAELLQAQQEAKQLEQQVRPLRSLPELLVRSQADIGSFYKLRLPARESSVQAELGRLAAKHRVALTGAAYESFTIPGVPDVQVLQVKAGISGEYGAVAEFINAVERSQLFFLIDGLDIAATSTDKADGRVQLQLTVETYLRPRTAQDFKDEKKKPPADEETD